MMEDIRASTSSAATKQEAETAFAKYEASFGDSAAGGAVAGPVAQAGSQGLSSRPVVSACVGRASC